jgi:hypothetical protein
MNLHWHSISRSPYFAFGVTLDVQPMGLGKRKITRVYHDLITWGILTATESPVLCLLIPLSSQPLETTDPFIVTIVLPSFQNGIQLASQDMQLFRLA